ncbi:HEAT repeat domain-containing protein [Streptomyces mirabilis]|uniref:HEAT repeat domain-containing protein n=1 Tax=Streptomyces mirabilis TaxID=68239 RepID=UPI003324102F
MFTGMDEVGWASMKHAYGSAEDVPELLRGLASACPQERERALDGMYGAVHHQGDVYDSTLACIPFLFELVGHAELRDRGGVVELLVSIGGGDAFEDGPFEDGDGAEGNYAMARTAVRSGATAFIGLLADRDPEVRRAAPTALVRFLGQPERVLGLLTGRLEEEEEEQVRSALAEGLGLFARLHPASAAPAVECLIELGAAPHDPGLRLAALGQLAGCAPDRLPADLVPTVIALLRARSRRPRVPDQPERPDTDTLIGHLRRLRPADEEGGHLLRTLHTALGGRTADRIALLKGQLSSDESADRWLGHAPAVPEMLRLLHGAPEGLRSREWLVGAIAGALGRCGPDAREAIPALRELLDGGCAVVAADALWSLEGDAEAVLPTLRRELVAGQSQARNAAEALSRLGPAARPALPALRGMANSGKVWLRANAAAALWDIARDPGPVLPALRSAWEQNAHTRAVLADCLTRMGPAGAPAHDLLRTELATPRRHQARAGGYGSHDIAEDEELLRACRAALDAA